ncbi:MAG: phage tail protein [Cetobacterium sp.]
MADLMLSNSTWAAGTTDTASTLANGIDQKRAEHINGPSSAIISLETILGSASSLKGSHSDLATRLAVSLPASGVIIPPGTIWMYAGATPPSGWLSANNGDTVSRSTYAGLFAIIGITYGDGAGDGLTFSLPAFAGRTPVGVGTGVGGGASGGPGTKPTGGATLLTRLLGAWFGHDTHQLTEAELAAHTHNTVAGNGLSFNSAGGGQPIVQSLGSITSSSTGGSQPHTIVQASLGVNFIIKT